ncbi:MAG: septum formation initiator family protein [Atribacteria sp.]|nr:septum formation initiator family protein [Candidatus Atribacteria bacterium]MBU1035972.1 septum formation initiator family protein [bacterium]MBU1290458.1 septum formation initiator family protein [bacterium]MBU1428505.1 septum formation initiator family protein [bacterium]MBU2439829.1 septum formation initiator family protein [bacterium]
MISIRSIFHSKIVWVIILLLILYIVFLFSDKYARTLQLKEDIKRLESELEELKLKNNSLLEEVESLKSDKSVEKIAREELGLTKPDEILIKGIEK